ncbi:MAG: hypothetical protein IJ410_04950 [Oscillospiraceae bacterium]|nr:hypothetical protein [Oscillospiraceae bacterium]
MSQAVSNLIASGEWIFYIIIPVLLFFIVFSGFIAWVKYVNREHSRRNK